MSRKGEDTIMTTETMLMRDALARDLERYSNSVDAGERQRIMARMIDTVMDLESCDHGTAVAKIVDHMAAS